MRYRRATTSGACWFFTVNLADRKQDLLVRHIDLPRQTATPLRDYCHGGDAGSSTCHLATTAG